jgi:outer membrane protein assembly factor BamB
VQYISGARVTSGGRRSRAFAVLVCAALLTACNSGVAAASSHHHRARPAAAAAASGDWLGFLDGPLHDSYSPGQQTITAGNAAKLHVKWHDLSGEGFLASPTVADGAVFVGSNSGWFYKINVQTGAVEHKVFLGLQPTGTCYNPRGIVATATVAPAPRGRGEVVYVGAPNGYLYALNAANLRQLWRSVMGIPSATVSNYYDWSSPTVAGGKVYIGVSSACERPQVRGAIVAYNQATGKKSAETYVVPSGDLGGGVWSSVAVGGPDGDVFVTTGDGPASAIRLGLAESILKLAPASLKVLGKWQVPGTADGTAFGGSPVVFGSFVGACNKDGTFYVLRQSNMKLAWQQQIGALYDPAVYEAECNAAPVYNGKDLFLAGTATTWQGVSYRGSAQERVASTGKLVWETGLPEGVTGSPTMDGKGVLAVGTYDNGAAPNATYLIDAANGKILRTLPSGLDFAQSVFAEGLLFTANADGLYAWAPPRAKRR